MKLSDQDYDIIIIGAGASGAAAAWNLSQSNFKILCLEQGPHVLEDQYPDNMDEWEIKKQKEFNINPNVRQSISDYFINDNDSPISIANFNGVGGSTILYSALFPRFHESDFNVKTKDNVAEDWPFKYKDLEPFYNLNDKMMGVSGLEGDPAYPHIPNLLPPVAMNLIGNTLADSFNKLGWHWWPSYSAIITKDYSGRKINNNKYEFSGAKYQSKSSVDLNYLPIAIKNGVTLKANSRVLKILTNNFGKAEGVIYTDYKGNIFKQKSSIILLACSGIGTPRLLLNSANKHFSNGLANSSGLVGKNLMIHPLGYVEGLLPNVFNSNDGPNGCCICSHEFYETDEKRDFVRGYSIQVLRGPGPIETFNSGYKFKKINFGKKFHKNFFEMYGHKSSLTIICEDLPETSNFIELDDNIPDSSGMPGIKVHYKLSTNTKKMLAHGVNRGKELMKMAGARSILAHAPVKNTGWHLMGTTKMGKNKDTSVVNENGQTHDLKNLVILDSSVFITSGGVNPASTLQALSLKFTENIKKNPYEYN